MQYRFNTIDEVREFVWSLNQTELSDDEKIVRSQEIEKTMKTPGWTYIMGELISEIERLEDEMMNPQFIKSPYDTELYLGNVSQLQSMVVAFKKFCSPRVRMTDSVRAYMRGRYQALGYYFGKLFPYWVDMGKTIEEERKNQEA